MLKSLCLAADLLLPRHCVVCGKDLSADERDICLHCLADLPLCRFERWSHNPMADRFNAAIIPDCPPGERYAFAAALFFYTSDYQKITPALKYGRDFRAGRAFSALLGRHLASSELFADVDCIVPVPLHFLRRYRRGYNQAEIIARQIAAFLPAAVVDTRLLRRRRYTGTQTRRSGEDKRRNVSGAFSARNSSGTEYRHILLVDDVFTSGNTMAACHAALRKVFPPAVRISAATLAFVENGL